MAIPVQYATSNPVVRDALAATPLSNGNRLYEFVAPEVTIDAETVDVTTLGTNSLSLDNLRAADAEAKQIRFGQDSLETLTVVERAFKTTVDARVQEQAGQAGVNAIVTRLDLLREDLLDAQEYRTASLALNAANYAANHKDVTGLNFRTGDLMTLADSWQEAITADGGFTANKVLISRTAWNAARQNAAYREYAAGSDNRASSEQLNLSSFAAFLGVEEVRMADYRRKIGNNTTATQFWTPGTMLMFRSVPTISTRTAFATPVVPYGAEFGSNGQVIDTRTAPLGGTERLTEIGVYKRSRELQRNPLLAFLVTGIVAV